MKEISICYAPNDAHRSSPARLARPGLIESPFQKDVLETHPELFAYPGVLYQAGRVYKEPVSHQFDTLSSEEQARAFVEALVVLSEENNPSIKSATKHAFGSPYYLEDLIFLFKGLELYQNKEYKQHTLYTLVDMQKDTGVRDSLDRVNRLGKKRLDDRIKEQIGGERPFAGMKPEVSYDNTVYYSFLTYQLYILDCLVVGRRSEELRKTAITLWPILEKPLEELYRLYTLPEESTGDQSYAALKALYGNHWGQFSLPVLGAGHEKWKALPSWVREAVDRELDAEIQLEPSDSLAATAVRLSHIDIPRDYLTNLFSFGETFLSGLAKANHSAIASLFGINGNQATSLLENHKNVLTIHHIEKALAMDQASLNPRLHALEKAWETIPNMQKAFIAITGLEKVSPPFIHTRHRGGERQCSFPTFSFLVLDLMMRGYQHTELKRAAQTLWPKHHMLLEQFFSLPDITSFAENG